MTGPAQLNREQKTAVRNAIQQQFMPDVWQRAQNVLDYLTSTLEESSGDK